MRWAMQSHFQYDSCWGRHRKNEVVRIDRPKINRAFARAARCHLALCMLLGTGCEVVAGVTGDRALESGQDQGDQTGGMSTASTASTTGGSMGKGGEALCPAHPTALNAGPPDPIIYVG